MCGWLVITAMTFQRLVLIPGMGADHRMFDGIALPEFNLHRANWIPHRVGESLSVYSARFAEHYGVTAADILIGVSMGGIIAGAIAQKIPPQRLILVSSCTDIRQLSSIIRILSPMGPLSPFELARWLPRGLLPRHRELALAMLADQDMAFVRWACSAVMEWRGIPRIPKTVTIHGSADRVFPIRRQPQIEVTIPDGGHLMVMDRAGEVAAAIRSSLTT